MTIVKRKDITYREYIRALAESHEKISDIERSELAGHLLRRDMENSNDRENIFTKIMMHDNCGIADFISDAMIVELPENIEDLMRDIKYAVTKHYSNEIDQLVKEEELVVEEEKKQERIEEGLTEPEDFE